MKKLLISLGSLSLVSSASLVVVSCKTSENKTFIQFRDQLNQIKGTYDQDGNPLSKSGASVVYIGAKDNASSQSFEASLKKIYENDLQVASRELSKPFNKVEISENISFNLSGSTWRFNESNGNFIIKNLKIESLRDGQGVAQVNLIGRKFDATYTKEEDEKGRLVTTLVLLKVQEIGDDLAKKLLNTSSKGTIKAYYGYDLQKNNLAYTNSNVDSRLYDLDKSTFYNEWTSGFEYSWFENRNSDRDLLDVKMELRPGNNYYGAILDEKPLNNAPVYGIKTNGQPDFYAPFTTALDYANPKLNFQYFSFDKISDYWNSEFFNNLIDYLKKDILYQLGAEYFAGNQKSETDSASINIVKARVSETDNIAEKIKESKGPLFLMFKNGHLVNMYQGWNRYSEFGGSGTPGDSSYGEDLMSWAKELQTSWGWSAKDNLNRILDEGVQTWSFADKNDDGSANWDSKKNLPV